MLLVKHLMPRVFPVLPRLSFLPAQDDLKWFETVETFEFKTVFVPNNFDFISAHELEIGPTFIAPVDSIEAADPLRIA